MDNDDAVEGVLFLRTGDAAQTVLDKVHAMTRHLNDARPAARRQDPSRTTTAPTSSI